MEQRETALEGCSSPPLPRSRGEKPSPAKIAAQAQGTAKNPAHMQLAHCSVCCVWDGQNPASSLRFRFGSSSQPPGFCSRVHRCAPSTSMAESAPPGQVLVNPPLVCEHCRCSFALVSSLDEPRIEPLLTNTGQRAQAVAVVQSMRAQRFRARAGISGNDAQGRPGYLSLITSNEFLLRAKKLMACLHCRFVTLSYALFLNGHGWLREPDGSATAVCPSCSADTVIPVWSHELMERSWYHQIEAWHVAEFGGGQAAGASVPLAAVPDSTVAAPALAVRCCDFCDAADMPLQRCARCRLQWYCSRQCQQMDWKAHSKQCRSTTAAVMAQLEAETIQPVQAMPHCLPIAGALSVVPDAVLNALLLPFPDSHSLVQLGRTSCALHHRVSSFPIVWSSAAPFVVQFPQDAQT